MNDVRAAAVQLRGELFDSAANTEVACATAHAAADGGARLIVLPELFNTGFADGHSPDLLRELHAHAEVFPGPFTGALADVAAARSVTILSGFAERDRDVPGLVHNSAALLGPSGPIGIYRKTHIPREEKHYFRPGDRLPVWDTPCGRLGVLVCADNSFPEAGRVLALRGAEILAVPYAAQRLPNAGLYRWITATRAYENQVFVIAANRCGAQGEMVFAGTSTIAGPDGSVLATLDDEAEGTAVADLTADALLSVRLRQTRYRDRRPELYAPVGGGREGGFGGGGER
jgi:predicted amidohydrolase